MGDEHEAVNKMFTPEFRNRLDAIISFAQLTPDVISKVVEKFVFQLEAQLSDRNITIELTPESTEWLAKRGYDDKFGARPLARIIQEHIKKPLAEEILFGALKDGGIVRVLVEEKDGVKGLGFEYIKLDTPIKPRDSEDDEGDGETSGKTAAKSATKSAPAKPRAKSRAKRTRKPRGSKAGVVPKVPLGEG